MESRIEKPKRNIDWDKPQFLTSSSGAVVLSNGKHNSTTFEGVLLYSKNLRIGNLYEGYVKANFEPIEGEYTLIIKNN